MNGRAMEQPVTDHSHILFNKTPQQCRQLGARGGRAQARNRLWRYLNQPQPTPLAPLSEPPLETTAQAIAALDAQFPWLRGVEKQKHSLAAKAAYDESPA